MSYSFSYRDHFLTKLANSDRRAQLAYIDHFNKLGNEFDALVAAFDADPTDEAYYAIIEKYKYIYTVILSAECGVYTTWYCYRAIRPYSIRLRQRMQSAIAMRFGTNIFAGELHLFSIFATEECCTAIRRAELKNLSNVRIPEGVTEIKTTSFANMRIKSLHLPDSLAEICDYAFLGNPLKSVSIGRNVKRIGEGAFGAGKNILRIDFRGYVQEWNAIDVAGIASPWVKIVVTCFDGKVILTKGNKKATS